MDHVPVSTFTILDKWLSRFIWQGKRPRLKKTTQPKRQRRPRPLWFSPTPINGCLEIPRHWHCEGDWSRAMPRFAVGFNPILESRYMEEKKAANVMTKNTLRICSTSHDHFQNHDDSKRLWAPQPAILKWKETDPVVLDQLFDGDHLNSSKRNMIYKTKTSSGTNETQLTSSWRTGEAPHQPKYNPSLSQRLKEQWK